MYSDTCHVQLEHGEGTATITTSTSTTTTTTTTILRPFVRAYPNEPVPEVTFTHSHLSLSSIILYLFSLSIVIRDILPLQFTCLIVFLHNLHPSFFGLPLGLSPSTSYSIHFFTQSVNRYLLFAAHAHTIATCFAVVPRLCHLILVSLSTLYLELYLVA